MRNTAVNLQRSRRELVQQQLAAGGDAEPIRARVLKRANDGSEEGVLRVQRASYNLTELERMCRRGELDALIASAKPLLQDHHPDSGVAAADADEDGTDDFTKRGDIDIGTGGSRATKAVSMAPWESLAGPGINNADAIVFGPRGHVINPASDFGDDGTITLTLVNKRALLDGTEDTVSLKITRSGMVRMISSIAPEEELSFSADETTSLGGS